MASKPRVQIPKTVRREIVERFAMYDSSTDIQRWLREERGLEVELSALAYYNCDNESSSAGLAQEFKDLFHRTREAFLQDRKRIAIAQPAVRLRRLDRAQLRLDRMADVLEGRNNVLGASELVMKAVEVGVVAAKDTGGMYTNRRVVKVDPAERLADLLGLTPDQLPER